MQGGRQDLPLVREFAARVSRQGFIGPRFEAPRVRRRYFGVVALTSATFDFDRMPARRAVGAVSFGVAATEP